MLACEVDRPDIRTGTSEAVPPESEVSEMKTTCIGSKSRLNRRLRSRLADGMDSGREAA